MFLLLNYYHTCIFFQGFCVCQSGFTGEFCEFSCLPEFYGYNCVDECKCQNGATCNPKNGKMTFYQTQNRFHTLYVDFIFYLLFLFCGIV